MVLPHPSGGAVAGGAGGGPPPSLSGHDGGAGQTAAGWRSVPGCGSCAAGPQVQ